MKSKILLILTLFLMSTKVFGGLDLYVEEPLAVFDKPGGELVSELDRGDTVPISPKKYKGYRKVLVSLSGKRKPGYILASQIRKSEVRSRIVGKRAGLKKAYRGKKGAGVSINASIMRKGDSKITTAAGDTYNNKAFESFATYTSVFFDYPWDYDKSIRPYLSLRKINFKGRSELQGGSQPGNIELIQEFVGIGLDIRYYFKNSNISWWTLGIELNKGTNVKLKNDQSDIPVNKEDFPFYTQISGSLGWDLGITSSLFFQPEFKAGVIVTADPIIINGQFVSSLAYKF